jgi:hypothetical protein
MSLSKLSISEKKLFWFIPTFGDSRYLASLKGVLLIVSSKSRLPAKIARNSHRRANCGGERV